MKLILIFIGFICITEARAQTGGLLTATESLEREGRYVNMTVKLGNPLRIYVAGKEKMRIGSSDLKLELRQAQSGDWEELKMNSYGNYYSVSHSFKNEEPKAIEVRATVKKQSEVFKIKLKPAP